MSSRRLSRRFGICTFLSRLLEAPSVTDKDSSDRKGEVSEGEEPYIKTSVFYVEPEGEGRVYTKFVMSNT